MTPPPPSPRKATRQDTDTLSPPRTLSPPKKTARGKALRLNERTDLESLDLSDGAGQSLHRHSHLLPTPVKTPRKKSSANFGSTARSLFPDLSTSRRSKKPSGFSLDSFQEDLANDHNSIAIYTDSRDRIPELNDSLENPFLSRPEIQMSSHDKTEPKRRERPSRMAASDIDPKDAVKREDGMLYTFRGKKIFKKFEEKRSEEDENTDDELGFFAVRPDLLDSSVNLQVPRLTRSSIKGRRLFAPTPEKKQTTDEALTDSVDENEEATTDIEETVESTEGTDIVHSEGDAEMPARRSLRTRPARLLDGDNAEPTHLAVAETKKRGKGGSPFNVWARKKQSPVEVSTAKKREADASSALAGPASKKTRAGN